MVVLNRKLTFLWSSWLFWFILCRLSNEALRHLTKMFLTICQDIGLYLVKLLISDWTSIAIEPVLLSYRRSPEDPVKIAINTYLKFLTKRVCPSFKLPIAIDRWLTVVIIDCWIMIDSYRMPATLHFFF